MTYKEDSSLVKRRILATIPAIIGVIAFACSYVGNFYCDNVQFIPEGTFNQTDIFRPRPLSYGLWMYRQQMITSMLDGEIIYSEKCMRYEEGLDMIDTYWKIARAFSCISIIIAGFILLWQCCAPFLLFDSLYWKWAMVIFAFIGICQGTTLTLLSSNVCTDNTLIDQMTPNPELYPEQCQWDWGTYTTLLGTILYFVTVASMLVIPAPGLRPNERQFPMMVWDDDDEDDEESIDEEDDDSFVSDDEADSIDSFACDDVEDDNYNGNVKKPLDETERSNTGYDDDDSEFDDDEITVKEITFVDYDEQYSRTEV